MKNEINAVLENMTTTIPEPEDYTGEDGLLYCGKCRKPKEAYFAPDKAAMARTVYCTAASAASRKKPILRRTRPLSLAVTATRQNATAREPPARNGRPPKSGAGTLTPWKN